MQNPNMQIPNEFESVRRRPARPLTGLVIGYHGYLIDLTRPRVRLEIPCGTVTALIVFEGGLRLHRAGPGAATARTHGSLVSGLRTTATIGEHAGRLHGIEITLSPLGAYRLLGIPMSHLTDSFADLVEILGPSSASLVDRLHSLPHWADRFDLLDAVLTARLEGPRSSSPQVSPQVRQALWQLRRTPPPGGLRTIAEEIGWSERHLRTRFHEEVGLPPKAMARVLRLQRALRLQLQGHDTAQVAALGGFHDQAHLANEFKAMTGHTLSQFTRHRSALPPGSPVDRLPGRVTSLLLTS
jgi:AraC-like DNA-binding protein